MSFGRKKQKETLGKEIKPFINEYDKYLIREKERIKEEETKQKTESEKSRIRTKA